MDFLVIATDKPDSEHIRDELRSVRIKWLDDNRHRLVAAGGMVDDRNDHVSGGLMIVSAPSREEAERFANEDPFIAAGLYARLDVVRWRRVFFNHQRVTDVDPFQPD